MPTTKQDLIAFLKAVATATVSNAIQLLKVHRTAEAFSSNLFATTDFFTRSAIAGTPVALMVGCCNSTTKLCGARPQVCRLDIRVDARDERRLSCVGGWPCPTTDRLGR
jgi:hypothetical protein